VRKVDHLAAGRKAERGGSLIDDGEYIRPQVAKRTQDVIAGAPVVTEQDYLEVAASHAGCRNSSRPMRTVSSGVSDVAIRSVVNLVPYMNRMDGPNTGALMAPTKCRPGTVDWNRRSSIGTLAAGARASG